MEEKNGCCKQVYKCGICGSSYDSVQERMNCEMECVRKQKEEEKRAAAEKRLAEMKARKYAVDQAIDVAVRLMTEYINDYGPYEYGEDDINVCMLPNKIWSYFWN